MTAPCLLYPQMPRRRPRWWPRLLRFFGPAPSLETEDVSFVALGSDLRVAGDKLCRMVISWLTNEKLRGSAAQPGWCFYDEPYRTGMCVFAAECEGGRGSGRAFRGWAVRDERERVTV